MMTEYSVTAIQHPSIVVAGCLGLFLSPYAVFQQSKLTQVQALEQTNSVLEDELRFLQEQQQKIQSHVQEIQATEQRGKAMQATLAAVKGQDAQSLQKLEQQVQESRTILAHMEQTAQANQLQTFITLLVNADADQNTILNSDKEVEQFLQSLESTIDDVTWNKEQIRQTIAQQKGSMSAVMELARQVIANPSLIAAAPVPTVAK
jgi:DNA repair exonuclease SbcCD ATPase subunit